MDHSKKTLRIIKRKNCKDQSTENKNYPYWGINFASNFVSFVVTFFDANISITVTASVNIADNNCCSWPISAPTINAASMDATKNVSRYKIREINLPSCNIEKMLIHGDRNISRVNISQMTCAFQIMMTNAKHLTHWQQGDISQAWWGIVNVCGVESFIFNEFIKSLYKNFYYLCT